MNRLFIIGIGMGIGTLTEDARNILSQADAVFGAKRMTALAREHRLCREDVLFLDVYRPDAIFRSISDHIRENASNSEENEASGDENGSGKNRCSFAARVSGGFTYVLLVSGDTGFYSAAQSILREKEKIGCKDDDVPVDPCSTSTDGDKITCVGCDMNTCIGCDMEIRVGGDMNIVSDRPEDLKHLKISLLPGISSVSYFFAKCALPWQDARLISCHGREGSLVSAVRRNRLTFALTGNNTERLAEMLCEYGFGGLSVHIGENLGSPEERITHTTIADLREKKMSSLTVLLIENPHADNRLMFGMEDDAFMRGEVPMTKAEIRAQIMARLQISPKDVCVDIGCGTGSVTVEMGLAAHEGMVYGFDVSEEAVELTRENLKRFQIANADIRKGRAPEILKEVFGSPERKAFQGVDEDNPDELRCNSTLNSSGTLTSDKTECHLKPESVDQSAPMPNVAFIGGTKGGMTEILSYLIERNPDIRICTTAIALETALETIKTLEILGRTADVVQVQTARAKKVGGLHMMMAQNPIFVISVKAR